MFWLQHSADSRTTLSGSAGTHPPTFERAREPLDVDHWLRQIESKFGLLDCTEHQKYATKYVNTEEKKRYAFLRGMNAALKERLTWQTTGTFNDLVNAAIVQEGAMRQVEEDERKRKAPASASAAPQAKHRLVYTSPFGQRYRTSLQQQF
ncbi:hypothetical protein PR202_gb26127 [Eleusine coracana subsp. coracana]|uniref:Uncharacterized protein n=1 Tax=Eleusine coracana subsp. coracana TaxID=191504 RepID=A0AAV5FNF3_ELECO|nr:hypothetical protein PR202_gb26127 [Eleusine coracana subsp. coracana]